MGKKEEFKEAYKLSCNSEWHSITFNFENNQKFIHSIIF